MNRVAAALLVLAAAHLGCVAADAPLPYTSRVIDAGPAEASTVGCTMAPGSVPDGWPCACAAECLPGATCDSESGSGFPGGMCARLCTIGGPPVCQGGAVCADFGFGISTSLCSAPCTTTADCPPHRYCETGGYCYPYCFGDGDCGSGHCDLYANVCTAGPPPTAGAGLYAPCVRDGDCRSGSCGGAGRCVTGCSISVGRCPENGVCVQSTADLHADLGFCFPPCTGGHCADGTLGCSATGIPQDEMACFLPGTAASCSGLLALPDTDALACGCGDDCSWGTSCVTEAGSGIPHGFCKRKCAPPGGTPCGAGYVCDSGICNRVCATDADCGAPGRVCDPLHECEPVCSSAVDCANGTCDRYTGLCKPTATTGSPMGAACAADADCRSGHCDGVGHYCWALCRVSAQGCPDGTVCAPADPGSSSELGYCYPPCTAAADCAPFGLTCRPTANAPAGTASHCE